MTNIKSQEPISTQDLQTYLTYLITQNVESEQHAKQINRLARRTTTLSDVFVLFSQLVQHQESQISRLIEQVSQLAERVRIQEDVLKKLGATEDMIAEAKEAYNESVAKFAEILKQQQEGKEEPQDEKESGE